MNYDTLSDRKLKDICKNLGLPSTGKKSELLARLAQHPIGDPIGEESSLFAQKEPSIVPTETVKLYHIRTNIANLFTYLNAALIYPLSYEDSAIYKEEGRHKDIFTRFPEAIILSKVLISDLGEGEVLIKVIGNDLPVFSTNLEGVYYTPEPIPASRIMQLLFGSIQEKSSFLSSLRTFADSNISEQLCEVINRRQLGNYLPNLQTLTLEPKSATYTPAQLDYYDKLLGMFAFMKNAAIFYADKEGVYQEYPSTFFSALNILNPSPETGNYKENSLIRYLLFPAQMEVNTAQRFIFLQVIERILDNSVFDFKLATDIVTAAMSSDIVKTEEKNDLTAIINKMVLLKDRSVAYRDLMQDDLFRRNLPTLALLLLTRFSNKNKQHTDKQSVRNVFVQHEDGLTKREAEFLLAVLGLYYGYKQMIRDDANLRFQDRNFEKAAHATQNIKFRLKNRLERFVIETCYRFSTKREQLYDNFGFLRRTADEKLSLYLSRSGAFEYKVNYTRVLETDVLQVERFDLLENIIAAINETYSDQPIKDPYIVHYILSKIGIDKNTIISLLRKNPDKVSIEDLENVIRFDKGNKKR